MSRPSAVYDAHAIAFRGVSAYAILRDGKEVARVTVKETHGGEGTCARAFVWFLGAPMVEGRAHGGGYDVAAGAVSAAARKMTVGGLSDDFRPAFDDFRAACAAADEGKGIAGSLDRAGFQVLRVV